MALVPAGPFWRGCAGEADADCAPLEEPGHVERLGPFWIDQREVSVAAYRDCVRAGACSGEGLRVPVWFHGEVHEEFAWACNWGKRGRDQHPVNCVSWHQARDHCAWLGKRLPSEAEYEKAARGASDHRIHPWGDRGYAGAPPLANIADRSALSRLPHWPALASYDDGAVATAPVGAYSEGASPFGVLDLVGNVEEWTSDWYDAEHTLRSIRGGSWHRAAEHARISHRYPSDPASHPDYGGFRCVWSPPGSGRPVRAGGRHG
jgi:formylglycine-generating enzyme required for sulfatase activity